MPQSASARVALYAASALNSSITIAVQFDVVERDGATAHKTTLELPHCQHVIVSQWPARRRQLLRELAADSLQIAQKAIRDASFGCSLR